MGIDMKVCEKCNNTFPSITKIDGRYRVLSSRKYCLECSPFLQHNTQNLNEEKKKKKCLNCGKTLGHRAKVYCSMQCQNEYQYIKYIADWKAGIEDGLRGEYGISTKIKRYLFDKYNSSCCMCGWNETNHYSGKIPLEVHHIDGDYRNNREENLQLLCPNCHSLTNNYKSIGKGRVGRQSRKKYYIS